MLVKYIVPKSQFKKTGLASQFINIDMHIRNQHVLKRRKNINFGCDGGARWGFLVVAVLWGPKGATAPRNVLRAFVGLPLF